MYSAIDGSAVVSAFSAVSSWVLKLFLFNSRRDSNVRTWLSGAVYDAAEGNASSTGSLTPVTGWFQSQLMRFAVASVVKSALRLRHCDCADVVTRFRARYWSIRVAFDMASLRSFVIGPRLSNVSCNLVTLCSSVERYSPSLFGVGAFGFLSAMS